MASEFLIVAQQVLERERRALSAKEIVDIAIRDGLFSDKRAGKTPQQTMKSKLSVEIRRLGDSSRFVRTAPGRFQLRRLLDEKARIYEATPLRPPKLAEDVLLFSTAWLDRNSRFQGIRTKGATRLINRLLSSGQLAYRDRQEAERLDDYKQVITYILVTRGNELLSFRRGNYNRVEDFLKGARCIGFGGHVSEGDFNLFGQSSFGILEAAARELREELNLPPADRARLDRSEGIEIVGVLNDDATANGRRHFAILLRYEVSHDDDWNAPTRNEKSITQLSWLDPEASPAQLFQFEYWSQLCLLEFYRSARITRPTYTIQRRLPLRPPHVVLVLGELGSGKTAATRVLKEDFSYTEINSGRVLAELLGIPPLTNENDRNALQDRAWEFINSESGPKLLAEALWRRVDQGGGGRVLIEGIRQKRTVEALKELAGERRIGVLFVHTPFQMAFAFYRGRAGNPRTIYDFISARSKPVELEAGGLVAFADAVLYNWSGEREYRGMIHDLMADIGVTP